MSKFKFVSPMWVVDSVLAGTRLNASDYFPNPQAPLGVSKPPTVGQSAVALPNIMEVGKLKEQKKPDGLRKIGDMMPAEIVGGATTQASGAQTQLFFFLAHFIAFSFFPLLFFRLSGFFFFFFFFEHSKNKK